MWIFVILYLSLINFNLSAVPVAPIVPATKKQAVPVKATQVQASQSQITQTKTTPVSTMPVTQAKQNIPKITNSKVAKKNLANKKTVNLKLLGSVGATGTCLTAGAVCTGPAECCNGVCNGGFCGCVYTPIGCAKDPACCAGTVLCPAPTLPCLESFCDTKCAQCCSGQTTPAAGLCSCGGNMGSLCHVDPDCDCPSPTCVFAHKSDPTGTCSTNGNTCSTDTDSNCALPFPPCVMLVGDSCTLGIVGAGCLMDADCSSGSCINNVCCGQVAGVACKSSCTYVDGCNGSCVAGKWVCAATGATCASSQDCCNAQEVCLSNGNCGPCALEKASCKLNSDCCSNNCDTSGTNPACPAGQACCVCDAAGQACTVSSFCCPGNICLATGVCSACILNGSKCTEPTDCCSNSCDSSGTNPACPAGQACCVCASVGKNCDNNAGCCSGVCTNGVCQLTLVGGNCATDTDCSSNNCAQIASCNSTCEQQIAAGQTPTYTYTNKCTCQPITNSCTRREDCCGGLLCIDGTCNCASLGNPCAASSDCCEGQTGQGHLACINNLCQPLSNLTCPENLGLDLAQIQTYFMSGSNIAANCNTAYKLLVYNYTLFAQYLTLVGSGALKCDQTINNLINHIYSNLVVLQANCNTNTNPANFYATSQVNAINTQYAASVATAASVFNNLALNPAVVNQIAATNYAEALSYGVFTGSFNGMTYNASATAQCNANASTCVCESDVIYVAPGASCISSPCCVGDINRDLNSAAASMAVTMTGVTNTQITTPYLVTPLGANNIVDAASTQLTNNGQYGFIADRFLSLVQCWLAAIPSTANCPAITAKFN